ncbi:NAD(P)-dependent oxidoreductase [Croceimicrobium sp.]|uniref:NAD(P)-dependent oxidoreductase n=1 Tax=Croceimicrobium sp. TaxID=2828340 RepID=UPI003BA9A1C1
MKFGIIREGKNPPDKRVPLSPQQCLQLLNQYPNLEIAVQPSPIRCFPDAEYAEAGLNLQEDLSDCDVLLGVKEVPVAMLIPNKSYLFFSHTYKKQAYNRDLLRAILDKKIRLIDYEMLKDPGGKRLLGFGRYAGIVGAYNGFRAFGKLSGEFELKAAHECKDRRELEQELVKVHLPQNFRIALTGAGKVAGGAMEILSALKITQVYPDEFIREDFNKEAVFTQLNVQDYFKREDGKAFTRKDFYQDSKGYESNFLPFAEHADMYIACHYWSEGSPLIFSRADARDPRFKINLVADISCDIDGPVASTIRPSTIADPFYAYDPQSEKEVAFGTSGSIAVSAVDNLPGELPRDASEDFGNELIKNIIPNFFNGDPQGILAKASETELNGKLSSYFAYLKDYVA